MKLFNQKCRWFIPVLLVSLFSQMAEAQGQSLNPISSLKNWDVDQYIWGYAKANKTPQSKLPIDFTAMDKWQSMSDYLAVSNDGKYFAYGIECVAGSPIGQKNLDSLIIQAIDGSWRRSYSGIKPGFFSANSKQYVMSGKNQLCLVELGTNNCSVIDGIKSFAEDNKGREWIAYNKKGDEKTIVLHSLLTGLDKQFHDVSSFSFDPSGKWLVCKMTSPSSALDIYHLKTGKQHQFPTVTSYTLSVSGDRLLVNKGNDLQYVNLVDNASNSIWQNNDSSMILSDLVFDGTGKQVLFTIRKAKEDRRISSVFYYREGIDQAKLKVGQQTPGSIPSAQIFPPSFTGNGHYINVTLLQKSTPLQLMSGNAQLDVWSYKDINIQSKQGENDYKSSSFVISVEDNKLTPLYNEDESVVMLQGDYAVVKKSWKTVHGDRFWDNVSGHDNDSNWLVSLKDGRRHLLPIAGKNTFLWFSPGNRYLVYFDARQACHYFSYDLLTGKTVNISHNIQVGQLGFVSRHVRSDEKPKQSCGLAAWCENDSGLLVYDNNDIWQLDLSGKKSAINLTNGYGRNHGIIFRLMNNERHSNAIPTALKANESLLLNAFNTIDKSNGSYRIKVGVTGDPILLSMGPVFMHVISDFHDPNLSNIGLAPLKAQKSNTWIMQRQSIDDAPNYFSTTDFKSFKRMTHLQPQQGHKWIAEELHSFKHLDGNTGQGILYKPENFDSSKKYPVLIVFYGKYSNNMHQFPIPSYNYSAITTGSSPIWFVNNGYLVFTPDIYVTPGKYGPQAFNVIEGAAKYLKSLPYVDDNGLGCATHSWSAKLGAYLFTHSKSFTATSISEGFLYGNMTNVALSKGDGGLEQVENVFEFGSLYANKNSWIDHTTVLNVDKGINPLLLFCNKESSLEYQDQTLQFYTALRRQDKKVWWLKYDKGGHVLFNLNEQKDYTIRYTQFFDHYLKKGPAPRWMTQGVPYALRGVEQRFELDAAGSCDLPDKKECHICTAWNKQYKRNPAMFEKPIREWKLDKDVELEMKIKQETERAKLDKEGEIETKRILDILNNGYPEDEKRKKENAMKNK